MRKAFVIAALAALFPGLGLAADLKTPASAYKAPAAIAAPIDPWTGLFIGANVGYGFDLSGMTTGSSSPFFNGDQLAAAPQGVVGGVQAGYNQHFANIFVLGIRADINAGSLKGTASMPTLLTAQSQDNWFGSVVGRAGITLFPNMLLYGDAGLAFGNPRNTFTFDTLTTGCGATTVNPCAFNANGNSTGIAWGFGSEFVLTPDGHWKLGFEWQRYDFGKATVDASEGIGAAPGTITFTSTNRYDVIRGMLNYSF